MNYFSSFKECRRSIKSSAFRYNGSSKFLPTLKLYFFTIGFRYIVWMRLCSYFMDRRIWLPIYFLSLVYLRHLQFKSGIQISWKTIIGDGFYIGHFGNIVVSPMAVLGKNINISQGVCIGAANRGSRQGAATIGNSVYIGPGSKIVGAVNIGDDVCIGANAVVTSDIVTHACVGGVPATILSMNGTFKYIENTI